MTRVTITDSSSRGEEASKLCQFEVGIEREEPKIFQIHGAVVPSEALLKPFTFGGCETFEGKATLSDVSVNAFSLFFCWANAKWSM